MADITLEEAKRQISNSVYEATRLLENLEHAGYISGNGHHMRQEVAESAATLLESRWNEKPS